MIQYDICHVVNVFYKKGAEKNEVDKASTKSKSFSRVT